MPEAQRPARIIRDSAAGAPYKPVDSTRFILINTSHAGNVGATARAMKVMGFRELVLVAPRFPDVLCHEEAGGHGQRCGRHPGPRACVVGSLAEALEGVDFACATAMTPRDFGPPVYRPRELFCRPGRP